MDYDSRLFVVNRIGESVFLINPARRPLARKVMFERFWLSNTRKKGVFPYHPTVQIFYAE